ncbi:hypothetical protein ACIQZO_22175 [Streptomyces sp. NPDC097617]|uniref:hypothetical protein n=1 Tax=Streptomyces sp. NPDC097617 TaxID=3366091 RepID=UPI0037F65ABC
MQPPLFVLPHERRAARTIRSLRRLGSACAVGGLLVATVAGTGAVARADPPAGPRPTASAGPGCSLPSDGEFASCVQVQASLAKSPAVGETVDVRVEVLAQFTREAVQVQVDLPENLAWESLPTGMREVSGAKAYGQVLHRAGGGITLSADRPVVLTGKVRATSTGRAQIRARVTAGDLLGEAAETLVQATVTAAGAAPTAAAPHHAVRAATRKAAAGVAPQKAGLGRKAQRFAPVAQDPPASRAARAGGTADGGPGPGRACVSGGWEYLARNGSSHASMNVEVKAFDVDASGESLLAVGVTDQEGNYELCFPAVEEDGSGQDVVLAYLTENNLWALRQTGSTETGTGTGTTSTPGDRVFEWGSEVFGNVTAGLNVGVRRPAEPTDNLALETFDAVNDVALWRTAAGCWDEKDTVCQQIVLHWSAASTEGTLYSFRDNAVHLNSVRGGERMTVAHEMAHAIMDMSYRLHDEVADHSDPMEGLGSGCANPHYAEDASTFGCAWLEGFADWVALSVYQVHDYCIQSGCIALETPTWATPGWNEGMTVEGRVAAALHDLEDAANEKYWDRTSEGPAAIWHTMQHHVNVSFPAFWESRRSDGYPTTTSSVLATLFQNTIDLGFRDPLTSDVPVYRPHPATAHNFRFDTVRHGWSVMAVRPAGTDYDLRLFDDSMQATSLGESNMAGPSEVDFVAVDSSSGRRALGDYYPRVPSPGPGTTAYRAEFAEAPADPLVREVPRTVSMAPDDVAAVFNVALTGERVRLTLTPENSTQDGELYVMCSTADATTWVANRAHHVARANASGRGGTETVTFEATGSCAVVVINRAGKGKYRTLLHVVAPIS